MAARPPSVSTLRPGDPAGGIPSGADRALLQRGVCRPRANGGGLAGRVGLGAARVPRGASRPSFSRPIEAGPTAQGAGAVEAGAAPPNRPAGWAFRLRLATARLHPVPAVMAAMRRGGARPRGLGGGEWSRAPDPGDGVQLGASSPPALPASARLSPPTPPGQLQLPPPTSPASAEDFTQGNPSVPEIAFTFDGHDGANVAGEILDFLQARGARATLFLGGRFIRAFPDLS